MSVPLAMILWVVLAAAVTPPSIPSHAARTRQVARAALAALAVPCVFVWVAPTSVASTVQAAQVVMFRCAPERGAAVQAASQAAATAPPPPLATPTTCVSAAAFAARFALGDVRVGVGGAWHLPAGAAIGRVLWATEAAHPRATECVRGGRCKTS